MTRKGIVLKIEEKKMAVMTSEGEFIELPLPKAVPSTGDTIPLEAPFLAGSSYRLSLVAALLVIILSFSIFRPLVMPQAVASVAFDFPVGIELGVDKDNKVVRVRAKDARSQALIQNLHLKGEDIYSAANQVVGASYRITDSGIGQKESTFMVTVMPLRQQGKVNFDHQRLHAQMLQELNRQEFEGYLIVQGSDEDLRKEASQLGLSVAKYLLWERNQGRAADFGSVEELKNFPLELLVSQDEEVLERRFPGMWCRVGENKGEDLGSPSEGMGGNEAALPRDQGKNGQPPMKGRGHQGFMQMHRGMN